ncbi:MAG: hypothetical protein HKN87_10735 [Saprospiraceae bacterium]|nr:hypothetical protein [Saprospiraceae bacterium]
MSLDIRFSLVVLLMFNCWNLGAQQHPEIYITDDEKVAFMLRLEESGRARAFVEQLRKKVSPYVYRHKEDPTWIVSRLQMYWNTKYARVYVNGMDFSHGEGQAAVPTVRFSGSRDWATDYLRPDLEDVLPFMDDRRGLYLQNGKKKGEPWEWVHPSETGHIVERINEEILDLAADAAFLYWLEGDERYATFASDIFITYIVGMFHREPPRTTGDHKNKLLMGLQTFEVIHERIVEPLTICYDFVFDYLVQTGKDLDMVQEVFRRWAEQEIKYGVPDNNWNLMQARYIAYLAFALEHDAIYPDGKGQEYYIDQLLYQNTAKQKALRDVMKNFETNTAIWPEVAHYSIMVSDDLLEIFCLLDKTLDNQLLMDYPILEKAIFANFNYLFPNDFTVAYGDAKHARLRFNALELLVTQFRKYNQTEKEALVTSQLKRFLDQGAYDRDKIGSLFQFFFYVDELKDVPTAKSIVGLVNPTFYSPNVSWIVQRNGQSLEQGMMVSKNASLGNHSHTNGINIELFAKGMVIVPDAAAGVSYWTKDHREYYSRFPAHNTVIVDGISDYRNMRGSQAFDVHSIYPDPNTGTSWEVDYTYSDVSFHEISTDALQRRSSGTIRTSEHSGFFIDIFRSARQDGQDKKHEYVLHGQGDPIQITDFSGKKMVAYDTDELSSKYGDQLGYDYFSDKKKVDLTHQFKARFSLSTKLGKALSVDVWMKGEADRSVFTCMAPYSRAIHPESVPSTLYKSPSPTLIIRQAGEALTKPFVSIIDAFSPEDPIKVEEVAYFSPLEQNTDFVGVVVQSSGNRIQYIYNDIGGRQSYEFNDGSFLGSYGIASFNDGVMQSLLLVDGQILEKGIWKIASMDADASISVTHEEEEFIINANQPFVFRMPIPSEYDKKSFIVLRDKLSGDKFLGTIQHHKKSIEFALPRMENHPLDLISE